MNTVLAPSRWVVTFGLLAALGAVASLIFGFGGRRPAQVMVVMDPLAKQIACACVKGYAQRNYDQLAAFLSQRLGEPIRVAYSEDMDKALREVDRNQVILIIGKDSVVRSDAGPAGMKVRSLYRLTGKNGQTTQTGLFVVKAGDSARTLADLKDRRVFFGPPDTEEKHGVALAALRAAGVSPPEKIETRPGCSDAALDVQDSKATPPPCAVISSYALPLLEGCGSIDQGSLRVIGETAPVPFITLFATDALDANREQRLRDALSALRDKPALLLALESRNGFLPVPEETFAATNWPGWRGPNRDGRAAFLPDTLPGSAKFAWKKTLTSPGLAGIASAEGRVMVAGRDLLDERDQFLCLRASDGEQVWQLEYPAPGHLDYGASPRATPVIHEGKVYLLGAFGDLHCVSLADGSVVWKKHLSREFKCRVPKWGYSSTPLIVADKLIINPGAKEASIAALDLRTGGTLWSTPGSPAAYASFLAAPLGGRTQIVGYDATSLGGWDPRTGRRLWTLVPPNEGDFNVPTPIAWNGKLLVATENNGTRLYGFQGDGTIIARPLAEYAALAPDVNTPVIVNDRLFGCQGALHCVDLAQGLKPLWIGHDESFGDFASLIAAGQRILISTYHGELLLVNAAAGRYEAISRLRVFDAASEIYAHPALVGENLFIRDGTSIGCLKLGGGPVHGALTAR